MNEEDEKECRWDIKTLCELVFQPICDQNELTFTICKINLRKIQKQLLQMHSRVSLNR